MSEPKHFNAGHVWGRVVTAECKKSDRQTPYLAIQVDCTGPLGSVRAYGRLWGQAKIDDFLASYKANPGGTVHLSGFFSQYEKDGDVLSNYTFFKYSAADGEKYRAAFILAGEVVRRDDSIGEVDIFVRRPGADGYDDSEETFTVWIDDATVLGDIKVGDVVRGKGVLKQRGGMDFFGDTGDEPVLPYIMEVKGVVPF